MLSKSTAHGLVEKERYRTGNENLLNRKNRLRHDHLTLFHFTVKRNSKLSTPEKKSSRRGRGENTHTHTHTHTRK